MDADLVVGPVEQGGERHDVGVFHLAEVVLDVGLGAVVGDDVGAGGPGLVGEQDPCAEQFGFESGAVVGFGPPCQAQLGPFGKYASVREPNIIIPKRSPRASRSPCLA